MLLEHKEQLVLREQQVRKALRAHKEPLAHKEPQVAKVFKEMLETTTAPLLLRLLRFHQVALLQLQLLQDFNTL